MPAPKTPYILTDAGRYADLMKQGFMKPMPKPRPKKEPLPIVSCTDCMNWHRKGAHTATVEVRRINRTMNKAKDARAALIRAGIDPDTGRTYD